MCCWPFAEVVLEDPPKKKKQKNEKKKPKEYVLLSSDFHAQPIVGLLMSLFLTYIHFHSHAALSIFLWKPTHPSSLSPARPYRQDRVAAWSINSNGVDFQRRSVLQSKLKQGSALIMHITDINKQPLGARPQIVFGNHPTDRHMPQLGCGATLGQVHRP